jgi:hypothetical protein
MLFTTNTDLISWIPLQTLLSNNRDARQSGQGKGIAYSCYESLEWDKVKVANGDAEFTADGYSIYGKEPVIYIEVFSDDQHCRSAVGARHLRDSFCPHRQRLM